MNNQLPEIKSVLAGTTYRLIFISPMAMHGANANSHAEFRTASFKGILRYWWRSLQTEPHHDRLLEEEVKLFGGTNTDYKRKSPVIFTLSEPVQGRSRINVLPHRTANFWPKGIEPNCSVTLKMQVLKQDEQLLSIYENYMNFMLHLAGMGQRARRGFGACQWEKHEWEDIGQFFQTLRESLKALGFEGQFDWNENGSCLLKRRSYAGGKHPILQAVYIGAGSKSVEEVLRVIGNASHRGNPHGNLGSAKPRWASPLWCTVRKIGPLYYPIITEMQTSREKIRNEARYERDKKKFLELLGVRW